MKKQDYNADDDPNYDHWSKQLTDRERRITFIVIIGILTIGGFVFALIQFLITGEWYVSP